MSIALSNKSNIATKKTKQPNIFRGGVIHKAGVAAAGAEKSVFRGEVDSDRGAAGVAVGKKFLQGSERLCMTFGWNPLAMSCLGTKAKKKSPNEICSLGATTTVMEVMNDSLASHGWLEC